MCRQYKLPIDRCALVTTSIVQTNDNNDHHDDNDDDDDGGIGKIFKKKNDVYIYTPLVVIIIFNIK